MFPILRNERIVGAPRQYRRPQILPTTQARRPALQQVWKPALPDLVESPIFLFFFVFCKTTRCFATATRLYSPITPRKWGKPCNAGLRACCSAGFQSCGTNELSGIQDNIEGHKSSPPRRLGGLRYSRFGNLRYGGVRCGFGGLGFMWGLGLKTGCVGGDLC